MKLNQYAYVETPLAQQRAELDHIGLPTRSDSLASLAHAIFSKFEAQAKTPAAKDAALKSKAVTSDQDLLAFLTSKPTTITRAEFAAIALQYLGFEAGPDFELAKAVQFMTDSKLPLPAADITTQDDFVAAVYRLLNTRSKHLGMLVDLLADRGFFSDQLGDFTFLNGKALPTFDTRKVIRESVWIESDMDTDGDGKRDMLEATIFRPSETEGAVRVPALFTANPYFHGTNDVEAVTHVPEPNLAVKPARTQAKAPAPDIDAHLPERQVAHETTHAEVYADEAGIYSLNDYFLARGFATVYSAGIGTRDSDGLRSTGGPDETAGAVNIIEWLGGTRRAFTTRDGHTEIKAWWCNHKVAMTGKSYLGTLAIAAATSGTPALKTVISEAAISSWYDYYREGGLVVAPGGFQGEDADVLGVDTYSRLKNAGDALRGNKAWTQRLKDLGHDQDRTFGDYTPFWDARNYRNNLANVKCDIVSVHGLNDWNVKPHNVIKLHEQLRKLPVRHIMYMHQGQHVYLNNVRSLDFTDQMNLWLSHKLLGQDNGAQAQLPDVTIQDNVEAETWHTQSDFGHGEGTSSVTVKLGDGHATFTDNSTAHFKAASDNSNGFEKHIIEADSVYANDRLILPLPDLPAGAVLEGVPTLQLKLTIDQPSAIVSVRLVELGSAKRFRPNASIVEAKGYAQGWGWTYDNIMEFTPTDKDSEAKLISFAHVNTQNPDSPAVSVAPAHGEELTLNMPLQPTRFAMHKDCKLALIVHGADMAQTIRPDVATNFKINLSGSKLTLPIRTIK
ncbi:Xaa-Pro dipeptidyl-peptidase [Lacticaseibacillus pabuli]|uniref:Xaa-Pro dipeptidyl-peptidase n=1 Tax=Lacticaseibacillus pabuli TaxID=3025672 RepID=A0ABY7WTW0_9LACO|nr:Xaa-Pro dipeptidyl-peptidase [Lacticaseibacillus sp. KACC 23028]WDF83593.1 Xaa-Pro dipeptidyl-peptidase [Lacticaseibacillus sp. KACC 23028]